ncbi:ABC transporter ATP-binding protein [Polynucleobacter paneuropaeus]|uniref:ABC transporter ATP-binding protein n=1 Tax=Polynucleobacter paneuropaeus TaxID=2527775 RepID=UPI000DBF1544|nr:ABC transporter ATP-binding protein [Polynucleobacter paneuropaeus]AWW45634.1 ABC transporter ATP-binding protein [Polynucleobacter paneuropaeus]
MKTPPSLFKLSLGLWHFIGPKRRLQMGLMIVLMIFSSFAEVFSIGAVVPFLAALTNPGKILENIIFQPYLIKFGISTSYDLLYFLTIVFMSAVIFAGLLRLLVLRGNARFSFIVGAELSSEIYRRCLYQPYIVQINRNSSEIVSAVMGKVDAIIFGVISPIQALISSAVVLSALLATLLFISPLISLSVFGGIAGAYLIISLIMRKQLLLNSKRASSEANKIAKSMQESLGGIRDVLLDSAQEVYCASFRNSAYLLRKSQGSSFFIGQSPRLIMEMLGMVAIAFVAFRMANSSSGVMGAVPILGALAIAAQRLLPAFQQIYSSWASIKSSYAHLMDVTNLLNQKIPNQTLLLSGDQNLLFKNNIELRGISFRYHNDSDVALYEINLLVSRGEKIGIIGSTGGGKSTLLDVLMGLLEPSRGQICLDGIPMTSMQLPYWQRCIAHVPQAIFLSDATIAENIAFAIPFEKIDFNLVKLAAEKAQIANEIESWEKSYLTTIGERGIRLSGGQRQRIGIARAFYKKADVIIFDEATSALDQKTETMVMNAIEGLNGSPTIFMVAHRVTTLQGCDRIIEIEDGRIARVGSYGEIVGGISGANDFA